MTENTFFGKFQETIYDQPLILIMPISANILIY